MAQLTISLNNQIIKRLKLAKPSYLIGRSNRCDIVLPEKTVSSQHAHIVNAGEDCFLEDIGSTNGVYVNSTPTKKHLLMDNDIIHIGKYELLFESPASLNTQMRQLSMHPRLLEQGKMPVLEIRSGRKSGHVIPLIKDQLTIGETGIGSITVERNRAGDYLLHTMNANKIKTVARLQDGHIFSIGEIELQFHQAIKTAIL